MGWVTVSLLYVIWLEIVAINVVRFNNAYTGPLILIGVFAGWGAVKVFLRK